MVHPAPFLFGATHTPLFLPTDFISLLRQRGFRAKASPFQVIGQKTPCEKAV